MAQFVLDDASVTINSVDLSDHVRSVTVNYEAEVQDKTTMGDEGREKIAGLKNWTADIEFTQDYAAGEVDATLFPLIGAAEFAVVFQPTSEAVSATNPSFTGNAILASYPPISGTVGDLATASITLEGSGILTRSTGA